MNALSPMVTYPQPALIAMNDTVVVYDRIRENLGKHRGLSFAETINLSISEMPGRTIITSGVTALSMITCLDKWFFKGIGTQARRPPRRRAERRPDAVV